MLNYYKITHLNLYNISTRLKSYLNKSNLLKLLLIKMINQLVHILKHFYILNFKYT